MDIHPAYGGNKEEPTQFLVFSPGQHIGSQLPYSKLSIGTVVTCVFLLQDTYYYDPDLKIDGNHWLKPAEGTGWIRIFGRKEL